MTTAGVCGLLISGMELNEGREVLQPDGTATNCGVYQENQPLANGLRWIGDHFKLPGLAGQAGLALLFVRVRVG